MTLSTLPGKSSRFLKKRGIKRLPRAHAACCEMLEARRLLAAWINDVSQIGWVDADGDGYSREIAYQVDVGENVGGTDVYFEIYDDAFWPIPDRRLLTSGAFHVDGTGAGQVWLRSDDSDLGHFTYNFILKLYRADGTFLGEKWSGNDADLRNVNMEKSAEDSAPPKLKDVRMVSWVDRDGDGFSREMTIDVDVFDASGGTNVYYEIRDDQLLNGYRVLATSSTFNANGSATQRVLLNSDSADLGHFQYNFVVSLRRASDGAELDRWNQVQDVNLANNWMEKSLEDIPATRITDARIVDRVDQDGDGYARSLTYDVDVNTANGPVDVRYEIWDDQFISRKLAGSAIFTVNPTGTGRVTLDADAFNLGHFTYNFIVRLYYSNTTILLDEWRAAQDPDLGNRRMEKSAEDVIIPRLKDVRMVSWVDRDGDGFSREMTIDVDVVDLSGTDVYYEIRDDQLLNGFRVLATSGTFTDKYSATGTVVLNSDSADLGHFQYNFVVSLRRASDGAELDRWNQVQDVNLANNWMEKSLEDIPKTSISDVRVAKAIDQDGDGYARSLTYEVDVKTENGPVDVRYEILDDQIGYRRLIRSDLFTVDPAGTGTVVLDADPPDLGHFTYNFVVKLFYADTQIVLDEWKGPQDEDLAKRQMELSLEDSPLAIHGKVRYRGADGELRNASYVTVEAWEKQGLPGTDYLLARGLTDGSGNYLFSQDLSGNPIALYDAGPAEKGTRDIYLKVIAKNAAADVSSGWVDNALGAPYLYDDGIVNGVKYDVEGSEFVHDMDILSDKATPKHAEAFGIPGYVQEAWEWLRARSGASAAPHVDVLYPNTDWPQFVGFWILFNAILLPENWRTDPDMGPDTVAHEYGHAVQFAIDKQLPSGGVPWGEEDPDDGTPDAETGSHWIFSESSEGFAMAEGWAAFFAAAVRSLTDLEQNEYWMGADGNEAAAPNLDRNIGNIVEGAVASVLWDLYDNADDDGINGRWDDIWSVMVNDDPDSIWNAAGDDDFYHYWNRRFGQSSEVDRIFIDHGIPVTDDLFEDNDTPASARALAGENFGLPLILADWGWSSEPDDWFTFTLSSTAGPGSSLSVEFENAKGNLDLRLYDPTILSNQWANPLAWSETDLDTEWINMAGRPAGTYYIKVHGRLMDFSPAYTLKLITTVQPLLSISDASIVEGNTGGVNMVFNVSMSIATTYPVSVFYSTADNTAKAGTDYAAAPPTRITFAEGETSKLIAIGIFGDTVFEPDELLYVNLTNPVNAAIADGQGVGTIKNDDLPPPSVSLISSIPGDTDASEIGLDPGRFRIMAVLPAVTAVPVNVSINFSLGGSAIDGADYVLTVGDSLTPITSPFSMSIPAGSNVALQEVTLSPKADSLVEPVETATFTLNPGSGYTVDAPSSMTITIADAPTAQVLDLTSSMLVRVDGANLLVYPALDPSDTPQVRSLSQVTRIRVAAGALMALDKVGSGLIDLPPVSVEATGKLMLLAGANLVLRCSGLALAAGSILDLADNDLIIPGGNPAEVKQWIRDRRLIGQAAEYRTLVGILNDRGDANHTAMRATFAGQNVLATDVLVKYTWNGDVTLDGRINADDYFFIDQGFLQKPQPPQYRDGDFNFDGKINADDYFLIDSTFLNQKGVVLSAQKLVQDAAFAVRAVTSDIPQADAVLTAAATPSVPMVKTSSIFSDALVLDVWN